MASKDSILNKTNAKIEDKNTTLTLADPGFDLRVGVDFVNGGGGRKSSESVVS